MSEPVAQQEPGPWTLARVAYEAYIAAMPAWDSLPPSEQARWEGVAATIVNTIAGPGYGGAAGAEARERAFNWYDQGGGER